MAAHDELSNNVTETDYSSKIGSAMGSKVSKKTRAVVVPRTLLRKIGHRAGEPVDFKVEGERILVTPRRKSKRKFKARIIKDPITGLPVLTLGPGAPVLTSEMVAEMLSDFP
jgi:bifunctional DNA-binding transcriptional regulator/antitoxin component of YhaV-PrlF toxin-antitoxin module